MYDSIDWLKDCFQFNHGQRVQAASLIFVVVSHRKGVSIITPFAFLTRFRQNATDQMANELHRQKLGKFRAGPNSIVFAQGIVNIGDINFMILFHLDCLGGMSS